jgi:hypothetical protein
VQHRIAECSSVDAPQLLQRGRNTNTNKPGLVLAAWTRLTMGALSIMMGLH